MGSSLDWVRDGIFYQIFPDRFAKSTRVSKPQNLETWESPPTLHGFKGGDLLGVLEHLDQLSDLGITALYLNPVFASTANHRYHTHDYFKVDPILGGDDALRSLIDGAHNRGMRVILDGVFNHASRGFYQFNHTLENGRYSPYVDWFHFNQKWLDKGKQIAAYELEPHRFEAPKKETSLDLYGYRAWWDIPALPKFNTDHPDVREYLYSVAEYWIQFGIDGWRLDVPSEIDDDAFWREFRTRVKAIRPDAYIVGEIWNNATRWLKGDQFDGVTNYLLGKSLLGFCAGEHLNHEVISRCGLSDTRVLDAEAFAKALDEVTHMYPREATDCQLNVVGSHDTPRILSMVSGDIDAMKLIMNGLFTLPGAPCIYYGDEIGMAGGHDPDSRRGFEWDTKLWDRTLREHMKHLGKIRKMLPSLRRGNLRVVYAHDQVIAYVREWNAEISLVCHNVSNSFKRIYPKTHQLSSGTFKSHLGGELHGDGQIELPPRSTGIWVSHGV